MRIVIALGGNALLKKGQPLEAHIQKENIVQAAKLIAEIAGDHSLIITHGNGPQVGLLAMQTENYKSVKPYPLDILGAESEGMLGYQIEQQLMNAMPGRKFVTVLTQVLIEESDPAFQLPTKPIGPVYRNDEYKRFSGQSNWTMAKVEGGLRRVVPSPEPKQIIELPAINLLVDHGLTVVCAGGGGIPVFADQHGQIQGAAAVIDKDLSSALLATELGADLLLLLTDIDAVYENWGKKSALPLRSASAERLRQQRFEVGSMGPKVDAACRFVEATGGTAKIGDLTDIAGLIAGSSGTSVVSAPATRQSIPSTD